MPKVLVSTVINAPIERVWRTVADYNGLPAWMPGMKDSTIEDGKKPTEIGAVRKLGMAGSKDILRERLEELDADGHVITYSVLAGPLPVKNIRTSMHLRPITDSYGTRTWWQREFAGGSGAGGGGPDGPAWCWLDTNAQVPLSVGDPVQPGGELALLGNRPNPYRGSTSIDFILPRSSRVDLEVFDLQGRLVAKRDYGTLAAGTSHVSFNAKSLRSGIYPYRIRVRDGSGTQTLTGRMLLER